MADKMENVEADFYRPSQATAKEMRHSVDELERSAIRQRQRRGNDGTLGKER